VTQIHWGGGTPTFFSNQQMEDLMLITRAQFNVANDDEGEFSIEIDPREVSTNTIALLRKIGFNRISIGVQDIDKNVQVAVNRIQSPEQTTAAIQAARDNNFHSISVDLIYGLPKQTAATFAKTLDYIIEQSPDRISVFNYAHLPERFKVQRQINEADLPSAEQKLIILQSTINTLLDAGYVYIGMDHFAKPTDALTKAQQDKRLYRNFQGYSTQAECDLIGMGMTSIGHIGDSYVQNQRLLLEYTNDIGNNRLAISKGVTLNLDDKIRKQVISELICHFQLDIKAIEKQFGITFADYFEQELQLLDPMIDDGLLFIQKSTMFITPPGRLLIRNICMVFDYYIQKQKPNRFSKVI
jgi:oxygen-independent coproporphyrinogen-3 oxidase